MHNKFYDYLAIEKKWQKKWFTDGIYKAVKDKQKKFFIHFAYPGVSGYLHVGHMRGFTYCDIIARYKRMTGYDVLFPAGFHASGIPSFGFAKKVERKDPATIQQLKDNGCTDDLIKKLSDPHEVVNYFSTVYIEDYWKRFGFLIDYTRLMSTISSGYKRFIQWQFHKLKEKNLLVTKPHYAPFCPNCGPVAVDKSETDISKGGSAEILEFTTIKFKMADGMILPAATLRPETIFGVTNMWIHPDVDYVKVQVDNETWICSRECAVKLSYQHNNIKLLNESNTIRGKDMIGKTCTIPLVGREIPILSGVFADPNVATGIVMSVPAHAPYDWIALVESGRDIDPIQIIDVQGFGSNPAKEICDELGIKTQTEIKKLDMATEILYKKEFHTGYLNEHCGIYAGIQVADIKDEVKDELIHQKHAIMLREFSEKVICRCGEQVVIKQIPDQWFIKYSDHHLTQTSQQHTQRMKIYPNEYKEEIPKVLDWFDDRACIRQGSWLGTEFPFKQGWIIEPISDSTLYPAYYIVSKYVNEKKISPKEMTTTFFDFVFLGKGESEKPVWTEIKADYQYWYPVDINLGGKEHKTVHFPVFIMNHVAILEKKNWPQGIFVHWWVTQKGKEKISKSKGGAEHITQAASIYGVDAMRLYYAHVGSPFIDIDWDQDMVIKYKNRIANIWKLIYQLEDIIDQVDENLDYWLKSMVQRTIQKTRDAFDSYDLRVAANAVFFEFQKHLQWYLKRNGGNKQLLKSIVSTWIILITPFAPHLAEELWSRQGNKEFVSLAHYPIFDPKSINDKTEVGEDLISGIINDIYEILKVTKIKPKQIYIYISPSWKQDLYLKVLEMVEKEKLEMSVLMKSTIANLELRKKGKEVATYISKLISDVKKLNEKDRKRYKKGIDEKQYLEQTKNFLQQEFSAGVTIFSADENDVFDPANRARFAAPLKPAIYIE